MYRFSRACQRETQQRKNKQAVLWNCYSFDYKSEGVKNLVRIQPGVVKRHIHFRRL